MSHISRLNTNFTFSASSMGIDELQTYQQKEIEKNKNNPLCNGGIIQGCADLPGVVFPGDKKNEPNILFRQNEFDQHCTICAQKKLCTEEIRKEILKIFEKDKKKFKKFLAPA